jgi:flagellar M-ring protein FliF
VPAEGDGAQNGGDQSKRQNERREEVVNYEVNTKTTATVSEGYKVEKLAVAVVINRKRLAAVLGANPAPAAVEARLKEVERLATSAAGLDTQRGDQITVEAVEFAGTADALEPVSGPPVMDQLLHYTGALLNSLTVLVVTLLLIWFGVRPALKVIAEAAPPALTSEPALALAAGQTAGALGAPAISGAPPGAVPPGVPGTPGAEAAGVTAMAGTAQAASGHASASGAQNAAFVLPPKKRLEQIVQSNEEKAASILKQWLRE